MYASARQLNTSPSVVRYIAQQNGWRRPASKCPHLVTGVINGRMSASHYKTLDFSGINLNKNKRNQNDT